MIDIIDEIEKDFENFDKNYKEGDCSKLVFTKENKYSVGFHKKKKNEMEDEDFFDDLCDAINSEDDEKLSELLD